MDSIGMILLLIYQIRNFKLMKKTTAFLSLLAIYLLIPALAAAQPANGMSGNIIHVDREMEERVDEVFSNFKDLTTPGASVAVMKGGEIIFQKGYGSANLEYDIPVTPATIFHVASVSKQFTAFAVLLLEEQGRLSMDDDIRKHIPEVPDFGVTITLRHLVTHTGGMRDQWNLLAMSGWRLDDVITTEHALRLISNQKELNFSPGEEFLYSNSGFTLLAEVVARVSGQSFAEFTMDHIFEPLQMTSTLFYDDHQKIVPNRAYSYHSGNSGFRKSILSYANVGATSLFTTAGDLMLWSMNLSSDNPKAGSAEMIARMNTPAILNDGRAIEGAMGQFVNTHKGLHQIQHGGADAGYRAYLGRFPDQDFSVAVLSNYAAANPGGRALRVADIFLEEYQSAPAEPDKETLPYEVVELSPEQLKPLTGYFWNSRGKYSREISIKDNELVFIRGGNSVKLSAVSENEFVLARGTSNLNVRFEELDGLPEMILTAADGEETVYEAYTPVEYSAGELAEFEGDYYSEELETTYRFKVRNGKLIADHFRHGESGLEAIKADTFNGDQWFFRTIEFQRDANGQIEGLHASSGRVRNLRFEKLQ